ncbi:ALP1-like protein [Tanacetum coccineum]
MNSEDIMFTDTEGEEEVVSRNVNFLTRAMSLIRNRRRANRPTRSIVHRDRYGAHDRLVTAFFSEHPVYNEYRFRKTFRMSRTLFNRIVHEVTNHSSFFSDNIDCTGKEGISPLMKCTSAIRQLTYGILPDFLDEYLQLSTKSSRLSLYYFCTSVMEIFGPEYLRKPTMTDVLKLYRHHEEKHGFPGMLGSLDCTDWEWFGCPYGFKAQYVRRDHAPEIPFVANGVTYPWGYYLVDGIYPELLTFAKTIPEPSDDDHKRILYKQKQEAARKDVKRAFGVLKKKWAILANPARPMKKERIMNMMYTCIILHNMIRKDKGKAISPDWYPEEAHQLEDPERSDEQRRAIMRHIRSAQAHQNLRADLVEHLFRNA